MDSNYRDSLGRFKKGRAVSDVPIEQRIKLMYSLQESWKSREGYIGDLIEKNPRIYQTWRGIRFTEKGKKIGCSEEWVNFKHFYQDVITTYKEGLLFRRLDTTKPYSKDNFIWVTKEEAAYLKNNIITIQYEGNSLTLKDAAIKYNQSLSAIKNRYHKHKDTYTTHEIIFGKSKGSRKEVKDIKELKSTKDKRIKVSKMLSSYKLKDKKKGFVCDLDIDFMMNLINSPCVYCGDTNKIGCDRIDNNKGHTKDNVVPCCITCNMARNDNFSFDEMKILGKTIAAIKENRMK